MLVFTRSGGERQVAGQSPPSSAIGEERGGSGTGEDSSPAGSGSETLQTLPSVTPEPPTPEPPPSPMPTYFVVANTGGQGLFLRSDHSVNSTVLETLPDGTQVEQVGEDFAGAEYVWRQVRAPDGQVGWVSVDWLAPAP
ncbi:MAG: SH3 domain-containing protein [Chloroflexaceae bacterium]|nr:SH3 domain-containing protein [Chloroflexaceae bacterium]